MVPASRRNLILILTPAWLASGVLDHVLDRLERAEVDRGLYRIRATPGPVVVDDDANGGRHCERAEHIGEAVVPQHRRIDPVRQRPQLRSAAAVTRRSASGGSRGVGAGPTDIEPEARQSCNARRCGAPASRSLAVVHGAAAVPRRAHRITRRRAAEPPMSRRHATRTHARTRPTDVGATLRARAALPSVALSGRRSTSTPPTPPRSRTPPLRRPMSATATAFWRRPPPRRKRPQTPRKAAPVRAP